MLDHSLSRLRIRRVIKRAITVNAIRPVLHINKTKNIVNVIMHMLEHKRNPSSILVLKRIMTNDSAITANDIVLSDVTRKIILHELLLYGFNTVRFEGNERRRNRKIPRWDSQVLWPRTIFRISHRTNIRIYYVIIHLIIFWM